MRHLRTAYSPNRGAYICARIARGQPVGAPPRNRRSPSMATIQQWLETEADFQVRYAAACELLADRLVAEIAAIADDASRDFKPGGKDGQDRVLDREALARAKLRIETRRWRAAKLAPHKYGEKAKAAASRPEPYHYEDILAALA